MRKPPWLKTNKNCWKTWVNKTQVGEITEKKSKNENRLSLEDHIAQSSGIVKDVKYFLSSFRSAVQVSVLTCITTNNILKCPPVAYSSLLLNLA